MANLSKSYGKPITRDQAQRLYGNFIKIKKRAIKKIRNDLPEDAEASRFHSGLVDKTGECCFLDNMFFFDKKIIGKMLGIESINSDIDGLVIMFGARDMEDSPDPNDETKYIDVDGRPTLLAFPFSYEHEGGSKKPTGNILIKLDDGSEHPGTGGETGTDPKSLKVSPNNVSSNLPISGTLPSIFKNNAVVPLFEI